MKLKKDWHRFAEVVDSLKSAEEFIDMNKIKPTEIIVVWDECLK